MYLERVLDIFITALAFFSTKMIWGGEKRRCLLSRISYSTFDLTIISLMMTLVFQDVCRLDQLLVPRLGLA